MTRSLGTRFTYGSHGGEEIFFVVLGHFLWVGIYPDRWICGG